MYLIALTTSTHWPKFELPENVPVTDTTLHLLGFGGLTFLLWQTRWIKSRWLVALIVAGWSLIDEYSQGIPILHRWVTWQDALANVLGVLIVLTWLWALRPIGLTPNRVRLAYHRFIWEEMFSRWSLWMVTGSLVCVIGFPLLLMAKQDSGEVFGKWLYDCIVWWCVLVIPLWFILGLRETRIWKNRKPCFSCGQEISDESIIQTGNNECSHCGAVFRITQWKKFIPPRRNILIKTYVKPVLWAMFALYVGVMSILLYMVLMGIKEDALLSNRVSSWINTLPESITDVVDLSVYLVMIAIVIRIYRGELAKYYDRSLRCRNCDYDLRGTPVSPAGVGTCGECGTLFLREVDDNKESTSASPTESNNA